MINTLGFGQLLTLQWYVIGGFWWIIYLMDNFLSVTDTQFIVFGHLMNMIGNFLVSDWY